MACSCSPPATVNNNDRDRISITDQTTPSLPDVSIHIHTVANSKAVSPRMRADQYEQLVNKILEFRRVRLEERAVTDRMKRICSHTRRLKRMLKQLKNIDDEESTASSVRLRQ